MLKLRELRVEKAILQKDIAKVVNKSAVCVGDWERGRVEPSIEDLIKLAKFFNCTVGYLLGVEDENGRAIPQDLPKKDLDLLKAFHKLRPSEQETVMIQIGALAEKVNV